jgi:TolB protein
MSPNRIFNRSLKRLATTVMLAAAISGGPLAVRASAVVPGGNGMIAFTSDRTGQQEIYTTKPDGSGLRQLTHSEAGIETSHPAWSPDGEWVVFNRDNHVGVDLWLIDRAGHREHQLTHLDSVSAEPAWAPDGSRIVFQHVDDTTGMQDLYTIKPDGTGLTRITNTPDADEVLASYSPDGKSLAYGYITQSGTATLSHVRVSDAAGGNGHDITPDAINGGRPGWSPDGKHIVFSSNNNGEIGVEQSLYTIDPDGSNLQLVLRGLAGSAGDTFPSYSPNGRSITFTAGSTSGAADIFVMRADGTGVRDITPHTGGSGEADSDWQSR